MRGRSQGTGKLRVLLSAPVPAGRGAATPRQLPRGSDPREWSSQETRKSRRFFAFYIYIYSVYSVYWYYYYYVYRCYYIRSYYMTALFGTVIGLVIN